MAQLKLNRIAIRKISEQGFDKAAKRVTKDAKNNARRLSPVDTGAYRNSFVSQRCSKTLWVFGNTQEYAEPIELGFYFPGGVVRFRDGGSATLPAVANVDPFRVAAKNVLRNAVDEAINSL